MELNPRNENAWNYLGFLLEDQKRYEEAEIVFLKSLEINPDNNELLVPIERDRGLCATAIGKFNTGTVEVIEQIVVKPTV